MVDDLAPKGPATGADGDAGGGGSAPEARRSRRATGPHVLLVDGDTATRKVIAGSLRDAGYEVRTAQTGTEALDVADAHRFDLVLLEASLPGRIDGFETCRLLRPRVGCPVAFVSARTSEIDRVVGLEVGADDYVTKPFGMRELLARVAALLRRAAMPLVETSRVGPGVADGDREDAIGRPMAGPADVEGDAPRRRKGATADTLVFDGVTINAARREVRTGQKRVSLKRREFDLLMYLARNHGVVLSRSRILQAVWPEEALDHATRTVDVHVSRVRDKVEAEPKRPRFIHTVRGTGYQFRVISLPLEKKEKHT